MGCHTGKDSTEDFEEIGHSKAAQEMLDKYLIGTYEVVMLGWCCDSTHGGRRAWSYCGPRLSPPLHGVFYHEYQQHIHHTRTQGGPPKASKTVHKVPLHRTTKQASPVTALIKGMLPILIIVLAVVFALYRQ